MVLAQGYAALRLLGCALAAPTSPQGPSPSCGSSHTLSLAEMFQERGMLPARQRAQHGAITPLHTLQKLWCTGRPAAPPASNAALSLYSVQARTADLVAADRQRLQAGQGQPLGQRGEVVAVQAQQLQAGAAPLAPAGRYPSQQVGGEQEGGQLREGPDLVEVSGHSARQLVLRQVYGLHEG